MADDKLRIQIEVAGAEKATAKLKSISDAAKSIQAAEEKAHAKSKDREESLTDLTEKESANRVAIAEKETAKRIELAEKEAQRLEKKQQQIREQNRKDFEGWLGKSQANPNAPSQARDNRSLSQQAGAFADGLNKSYESNKKIAESFRDVALSISAVVAGAVALNAFAESHALQVSRLGDAYSSVEAATNGAISASDALKLRGAVNQAGLQMTANQLGLLTRAAREYALATGEDASAAIEKLTNAIVNNSEDALSELGLAQARATTSTQTLANMTAELETRFRNSAPAARTLNEEFSKLPASLALIGASIVSGATTPLSNFIDRMTGLPGTFRSILGDINNIASDNVARQRTGVDIDTMNARERALNSAQGRAGFSRERMQAIRQMDRATAERFTAQMRSTATQELLGVNLSQGPSIRGFNSDMISGLSDSSVTSGVRIRGSQSAMDSFFAADAAAREARERLARTTGVDTRTRAQIDADDKSSRWNKLSSQSGGSSGPRSTDDTDKNKAIESNRALTKLDYDQNARFAVMGNAAVETAQAIAKLAETTGLLQGKFLSFSQQLRLERSTDEQQLDMFDSILAGQEGGGDDARFNRARNQRRVDRDAETRRLARVESLGGRVQNQLGFSTNDRGEIASFDVMKEGASGLAASVGVLQSGLAGLFDTLVSGSMDASTAFQAFASSVLSELGKLAFQKGLFYTFEGIAALFSAPPAAPAYLAAGVGLMALGGALGFAGNATKPQTPAPGSERSESSARSLAPRSSLNSSAESGMGATIVLSSLVPSGPTDVVRIREGFSSMKRTLSGNRVPRRIEQ